MADEGETGEGQASEDVAEAIAALDADIEKFTGQKRWSDVIKSMVAKGNLVTDVEEKVELYLQAGELYLERSSNQAEAIKCFQRVLEHDAHHAGAIARLKELYEKRRDWERLIDVMKTECDLLDAGELPERRLEIAKLAQERLRKPAICIGLWQDVLASDPEQPDAVDALAQLYERAREWEPLAQVLELRSQRVSGAELLQLLQKLGMLYADKLDNDSAAVQAFQRVLEIEPSDRRAQDQLKRRYVSLRAWDDLEAFYARTERWEELIRTLDRAADDKDAELDERTTLLFRVAQLWQEHMNAPDRAARAYEKVLAFDPDNIEAAEALSPIYEQAGDARKLAGAYEVRLRHVEDPAERVMLLRETALLYEEKLRNVEAAFEHTIEAFALDPMQEVLREDVERLAARRRDWDKAFAAYAGAIEQVTNPDEVNDLRSRYGRILADQGRAEDAIAQFRAVYEERGDDATAIAALEELYKSTEQFSRLLEVLQRRVELEDDEDVRKRLRYDIAELYRARLNDPDKAIEAYRTILELFGPQEADAYRALEELYAQQERWDDLGIALEERIDAGPESDEELASLKFRLAGVYREQLGDGARALDLYREVLLLMPEHSGAIEALEGLLADSELGSGAAAVLEPLYESAGQWEKVIEALEVSLGSVSDPEQRIDVITKIGEICAERVGSAERAFDVYARALAEAPANPGVAARLEELAVQSDRVAALVEQLAGLAANAQDPELVKRLWVRAGKLRDEQLDDVEGAIAAYVAAKDAEPGDLDTLSALEMAYRRAERWRDVVGVLRERVRAVTDPAEQQAGLAQMAAIHMEMLSEPEEAVQRYKEILEIDPSSRDALATLDDLYERLEQWSELADNVGRQLSLADTEEERVALMLRMASLRETRMGEVDAAIEIYSDVLDRDPVCEPALQALERLLEDETHRLRVASVLEPLYQNANEFQKLIGVYEIQARYSESPDRRVDLLHRMAELHETSLGDAGGAFRCYARSLAEDPGRARSLEELERLAAQLDAWQALATTLGELVGSLEDPSIAVTLHMKAAQVREERLGDAEGAIEHYRGVLQADPHHVDALDALERLYQATERYEDLAKTCLAKASLGVTPDEQREYHFRAASIFEEILDRPADAIAVYQQALEADPVDIEALDRLIALRSRLQQWEPLLAAYLQKAELIADPEAKKQLLLEVGGVYERELGRPAEAIDSYQRMLDLDPDDITALGRLDALYTATQAWPELLSVLEREADLAPTPEDALTFRYRIGELYELRLDDSQQAVDVYRGILDVNPDQASSQNALERMIAAGKEPVAAAQVLEPIYRGVGESGKLVKVLDVLATHDEDPIRKVDLLHDIAELHEVHLDQPREAFDAYARAFPLDNTNERTLASLERFADALNAWEDLARLYDAEIERLSAEAPGLAVDTALRLAQIFETQLGDVPRAIDRYRIVFEADPAHAQALEALDRLYEASERWPELAEVLDREAQVAMTPEQVLDFQFRLGQVRQYRLEDIDGAIDQYREILAAAPEYENAVIALESMFAEGVRPRQVGEILEPLYRMQENWGSLIGVYQRQLQSEARLEDRIAMMHRIAEIAEDKAGDANVAFAWIQAAYMEDPSHDHSASEAWRLAALVDGWSVLASTCVQILDAQPSQDVVRTVGRRLAKICQEELGDIERAEEAYRYVALHVRGDTESLEALDQIYSAHGASEALAEVLRQRASAESDTRDKVELSHRLGQVLYDDLGRVDDAIAVFRTVLDDLDAEHEETIHALQNAYLYKEDWERLYDAYDRELGVVVGDSAQADVLGRMAVVAWTKMGDLDRAVGMLRRVLDLMGEDAVALNALGNIYAVQENWADLVDVLEREVSVTDDDAVRLKIYGDLGRVWYDKLNRERNALESWERALDLDPGYIDALFAIAAIHRAAGATPELVDTLHRVIDAGAATLEDAAIEGVYMELGDIYENKLDQAFDAVESYRKALELNPRSFGAMDALERIHIAGEQWEECIEVKQRRVDALQEQEAKIEVLLEMARMWEENVGSAERVAEPLQAILEIDPMHEDAFARLQALYDEGERYGEMIDLYFARVEGTPDSSARVDLLRKVATVYEKHLGDKSQAFEALQFAWTEDFSDESTAAELERITGLTQKWNELLTTANNALQQLGEGDVVARHAICLRCARWYAREGHPEYAIPYLQQVLAEDPVNLPAMKQTAELYKQTQQWQPYAQSLRKLSEMTEDAAERANVLVAMAALQEEQFGSAEQAITHCREALELAPKHLGALKALERMHRNRMEWTDLLDVLARKVGALEDPGLVIAAKLELAEAYEDRVSDKTQAIEQYKAVLAEEAGNLQALKGLERLYAQQERWQELLDVLKAQLDIVTTEREQIALLVRIAGMWEEEFRRPEEAAAALERVVELDPTYEDALKGLERIYTQLRRFRELVDTYQRHADVSPDSQERKDIFRHLGATYRDELEDGAAAIEAFLNVTSLDEDDRDALTALAELYEQREEHGLALDAMEKLTRVVSEQDEKVGLLFRMGRIYDKELGDRLLAVEHFQRAIDLDPGHLASLDAMRDIHVDEGDWNAAARLLEQASKVETTPQRGAEFRVELARIHAERLDDHDEAIRCYEDAIKLDPDSTSAARPLVDEYVKSERWADVMPLLRMLTHNPEVDDPTEQQRYWYLYGKSSEEGQDFETAVRAYGQAFQLDSQDLAALLGLASAHFARSEWDDAQKFFQMALVHHRDGLGRDETADIFYRLGIIKREQGDAKKAVNMFEKALEEDELHRPTLEAAVALHEKGGDFEQAVYYKKKLLDCVTTDDERFRLYDEIGGLWQDKLKNPVRAIEALVEAVAIKPSDHRTLHKLLALYQSTGQWEPGIEIIDRIADLDDRPQAKAKYAYTVGVILRDELKDADGAMDRFNQALDLDAKGSLKAFEGINKILTQRRDWKGLERAFRKMLHRVTGKGDEMLEFNLWHNLGVIYRDRLNSLQSAAEAFAMASRIKPDVEETHQILAELYALIPGRVGDAVEEHRVLLAKDPYRVDSYRALHRLYVDAREFDKAWCVAEALVFLKKADREQRQFYDQYRSDSPIRPRAKMTNERWVKDLFHPDEDFLVGKLFEAITPAVLRIKAQPDARWQLRKKDLIPDVLNSTVMFARTFGFVSQVLALPFVPRLFMCADRQGALAYAATQPPATVCGNALVSGVNPLDMMFVVGKHLAYYRGEHYMRTMFQTKDEMKLVLLAAMQIAGMEIKDPNVDQWAKQIRGNMQPADAELLNSVGKRFVDAGARTDIKKWMRSVELTACRAGLLMCNDLGVAARNIQTEPSVGVVDLTSKEKIEDVVRFSVSEEYFRLREALGIQIQIR